MVDICRGKTWEKAALLELDWDIRDDATEEEIDAYAKKAAEYVSYIWIEYERQCRISKTFGRGIDSSLDPGNFSGGTINNGN